MKTNFVSNEVDKLAMKCKLLGSKRNDTFELLDEQITFDAADLENLEAKYYRGNCYKDDIKANKSNIKKLLQCSITDRQAFVTWKSSMGKKYPSCISSIHAIYDTTRKCMRYNVYIRSSDAYKKLYSDICFLDSLIQNHLLIEDDDDYILDITFGTVHVYAKDIEKNRHKNPKLIFFDGLDKTGKTAVQKLLFKMRDKIDFIGDRFMISPIAFNEIYGREWVNNGRAEDVYLSKMKALGEEADYFYFRADPAVIFERCIEHNEEQLQEYEKVNTQLQTFDSVTKIAQAYGIQIKTIDTTSTTPFDAAWECYKHLR